MRTNSWNLTGHLAVFQLEWEQILVLRGAAAVVFMNEVAVQLVI